MSIYIDCKRCNERNTIRTNATNRSDLERDKGEVIQIRCKKCSTSKEYHVNEFQAQLNRNLILIAGAVGFLLTLLFWRFGFVAVISFTLPAIVYQVQYSSVRSFNNYKIKEIVKAKD